MKTNEQAISAFAEDINAFHNLRDDAKMRSDLAARYLQHVHGFGTQKTLNKLRCVGGGPEFLKVGPQIVLYEKAALDRWARSKISAPITSTSQAA